MKLTGAHREYPMGSVLILGRYHPMEWVFNLHDCSGGTVHFYSRDDGRSQP
jgi:hypothetical protein